MKETGSPKLLFEMLDLTPIPPILWRGMRAWKRMVTLFRQHPRLFNRAYRLRQRVEAGWRSLKSLVGDIVRGITIQTIKAEIWSKITCYNLIWAIRRSHGF